MTEGATDADCRRALTLELLDRTANNAAAASHLYRNQGMSRLLKVRLASDLTELAALLLGEASRE